MSSAMTNHPRRSASVRALRLDTRDNVAVAVTNLEAGDVAITEAAACDGVRANETIPAGHKIALQQIAPGESIIKYGISIGYASGPINAGQWVHTHNCRSHLDERSHTLDRHTGAATDTPYI